MAKTTAHRIITKMRPNKQPRGQTSATSRKDSTRTCQLFFFFVLAQRSSSSEPS
jgi:hypothetical protein